MSLANALWHGWERLLGHRHKTSQFEFEGTPPETEPGSLAAIFWANQGPIVHKWLHYLPIYESYLEPFRGSDLKFLEIGVSKGGSLQMWREYFGDRAVLFGIDIDPECAKYDGQSGQVRIGSQDDPEFLARVIDEMGGVDVVLDDGSHDSHHIRASLNALYPKLSEGGLYMVFSPSGALAYEVTVEPGGQLALASGRYRVMLRRPDRADEAEVLVRSGELTTLAPSQMTRLPMGQAARRGVTAEPHSSLALVAGGGMLGPSGDGLAPSGYGSLGLRMELPWLTLMARGRYASSTTSNDFLTVQQRTLGAQLGALRLWDFGRLSLGAAEVPFLGRDGQGLGLTYIDVGGVRRGRDGIESDRRVGGIAQVHVGGLADAHFYTVVHSG